MMPPPFGFYKLKKMGASADGQWCMNRILAGEIIFPRRLTTSTLYSYFDMPLVRYEGVHLDWVCARESFLFSGALCASDQRSSPSSEQADLVPGVKR